MQMNPFLPVIKRAILSAPSIASDPEFQKKNESSEGSGIVGSSRSMSSRYGRWNEMLFCACTIFMHCSAAAWLTFGWQ